MRIVFFGPNGSGKGTQATLLKAELKVPHISTGDLLRAAVKAGTPLGPARQGGHGGRQPGSDEIVLGMLEERLAQPDVGRRLHPRWLPAQPGPVRGAGTLLDAPRASRSISRSKLDVPDSAILAAASIRFAAEHRPDDDPAIVRKRLDVYREQTAPVAEHFAQLGKLEDRRWCRRRRRSFSSASSRCCHAAA